jgi:hypothetical protein
MPSPFSDRSLLRAQRRRCRYRTRFISFRRRRAAAISDTDFFLRVRVAQSRLPDRGRPTVQRRIARSRRRAADRPILDRPNPPHPTLYRIPRLRYLLARLCRGQDCRWSARVASRGARRTARVGRMGSSGWSAVRARQGSQGRRSQDGRVRVPDVGQGFEAIEPALALRLARSARGKRNREGYIFCTGGFCCSNKH